MKTHRVVTECESALQRDAGLDQSGRNADHTGASRVCRGRDDILDLKSINTHMLKLFLYNGMKGFWFDS